MINLKDIHSLSDFQRNVRAYVEHLRETGRPQVLTVHGQAELVVQHAESLGANALIAIRYDATEIMSGVSEVLCYGTAVKTEAALAIVQIAPASPKPPRFFVG